jgi:hypothetical protein
MVFFNLLFAICTRKHDSLHVDRHVLMFSEFVLNWT